MLIPSVRGHGLGKLALALAAAVFVSTLAAENCAKQAKANHRPRWFRLSDGLGELAVAVWVGFCCQFTARRGTGSELALARSGRRWPFVRSLPEENACAYRAISSSLRDATI